MKFFLILFFICGLCQIFANNSSFENYIDVKNDLKNLYEKVTQISNENSETKKILMGLFNSNKEQSESINGLKKITGDLVMQLDSLKSQNEELTIKLQDVTSSEEQTEFKEDLPKKYDENILQYGRLTDLERLKYMSKKKPQIQQLNLDSNCSTHNCNWTVIQRREDGSENFYRTWEDYKTGFGNSLGEFFIGLDKLHNLTTLNESQELLIIMEDFENKTKYAKYDRFEIGNETTKYVIKNLGKYHGDAGDSLRYHNGTKFSTIDKDNDDYSRNCAKRYEGAWWFKHCYYSHLNGPYFNGAQEEAGGINWHDWHGSNYSLKFVEMMIRPNLQKMHRFG